MKTLHEEFREYESLWEETKPAKTLKENFVDNFKKAYKKVEDFLAIPENREKFNSKKWDEDNELLKPLYTEINNWYKD